MNYCILKSDLAFLLVMGGGLNHHHNFGYFDAMLSCHLLELLSPMLKILGNGSIESSLALFLCAEAILHVTFSAAVSFCFGSVRSWTFAEGFCLAQMVQSASGAMGGNSPGVTSVVSGGTTWAVGVNIGYCEV
jgi:hypothetical protein